MMFANKFVLSIKANQKILRENQGIVTLPFGQEFSLLFKNLNSRRAMVTVSIDGTDATGGTRLILPPNGSIDLERYIRDGNLSSGNKFKFIERSSAVEAHRGIKADDGIVRAEFFAEKVIGAESMTVKELADALDVRTKDVIGYLLTKGIFTTVNQQLDVETVKDVANHIHAFVSYRNMPKPAPLPPRWPEYPRWPQPSHPYSGGFRSFNSSGPSRPGFSGSAGPSASSGRARGMYSAPVGSRSLGGIRGQSMGASASCGDEVERGPHTASYSLNDAGITVPGSESRQQFQNVSGFPLESQSTVIVLQLRGEVGGVAVATPVTVQHKPTCTTCGKVNKAMNKYCVECGTALILI